MTLIIELYGEHRSSVQGLFQDYPCLQGIISGAIYGGMGRVFADTRGEPRVALAVLDFHFLAGDPHNENALPLLQLLKPGAVVIAPTSDWQRLLAHAYSGALAVYQQREAFEVGAFDVDKLRLFCQELPAGFTLRQVYVDEVEKFASDLAPALVCHFPSPHEFVTRGVGFGILHQGLFVAGASSAAIGGGKLEIEIQTHPQFRRRGYATAVAAALILYCLEHGLKPCWDAANEPSSALARKLGYHSTGKYNAYILKQPQGKSIEN